MRWRIEGHIPTSRNTCVTPSQSPAIMHWIAPPARKSLHDVILHLRDEPEVQENETAVPFVQQDVALVRVRVHEPGVRGSRDARLNRHLRHRQPPLGGQVRMCFPSIHSVVSTRA